MSIRNEEKFIGALQFLIRSIASMFYMYSITMLLDLIHKYF